MSLRSTDRTQPALRALVAASCIAAVLLALILSAIPRLHEEIHTATSSPNHECAVTLLTAGNFQHAPPTVISVTPPLPPTPFAHHLGGSPIPIAQLEFSLLEHAPPPVS
jgi:hypothetical protein